MELSQLKCFEAVARHQNYTRASEELFITQPALSATIKRLEADLRVPLFIRCKSGVELSEYGKMFFPVVQNILLELENITIKIGEVHKHNTESIRIIAPSGFVYTKLMDRLLQANHNISFIIGNISPAEVDRVIKSGEAHFCIYGHDIKASKLQRQYLGTKPNYLTVYKTHPLANVSELPFSALSDIGIVSLYRGTSPRKEFEDQCAKRHILPKIVSECPDIYSAVLYDEKMLSGKAALFGPLKPLKSRIGDLKDYRFIKIYDSEFCRVLYWNNDFDNKSKLFSDVKKIIIDYYVEENQWNTDNI